MNSAKKIWSDIEALRRRTVGNRSIRIAVLDGPVDIRHPCFSSALLSQLGSYVPSLDGNEDYYSHGTHVASVIFGRDPVNGIAPECAGLLINIYGESRRGGYALCSQSYLAYCINLAIHHGANIITISGGVLVNDGFEQVDPFLVEAVENCVKSNVLVVAAAGNDGCDCVHAPAGLTGVLAVGALNESGFPAESSNWGRPYQLGGILAPGENISGASSTGGCDAKSGTSFSTPIVAGVAALLMALQYEQTKTVDSFAIRSALIEGARPCSFDLNLRNSEKCLAGVIDVNAAKNRVIVNLKEGNMFKYDGAIQEVKMNADGENGTAPSKHSESEIVATTVGDFLEPSAVTQTSPHKIAVQSSNSGESSGGCQTCKGPQLVYALGQLDIEFQNESSRNGFNQILAGRDLHQYLSDNLNEAPALTWLLKLDGMPVYAIKPNGPFSHVIYEKLLDFLRDDEVERVSIPGYSTGRGSVALLSGEEVPVLVPAGRGMFSWSTRALLDLAVGGQADAALRDRVEDFMGRIYHDFRNSGISAKDRALNYAATNLFQAVDVFKRATEEGRVLETIKVDKSVLARPGEDLYDVKMRFFDPENVLRAKRVFRLTVDVRDVVPVGIGQVRVWSEA